MTCSILAKVHQTFSIYRELDHSYLCLKETCEDPDDCPDGLVCQQEKCKPCFKSGQCPVGQRCEEGRCEIKEPDPDCIESSDCPPVSNIILSNYTTNSFSLSSFFFKIFQRCLRFTLPVKMFGVTDFWLETRVIIKISTHPC